REVVHGRLHVHPVLGLPGPAEPGVERPVLRPGRVVPDPVRRRHDPLHEVPRDDVPHAGHVLVPPAHVVARHHAAVVEVFPGRAAQRLRQLRQPEEGVVVGLHHEVVGLGAEERRHAGEVGVRLAVVHVLRAVQLHHVAVPHRLQRHQQALLLRLDPAEEEADVDARRQVRLLERVHRAEQVPPLVPARQGQHAHEQPEVRGRLRDDVARRDAGAVGAAGAGERRLKGELVGVHDHEHGGEEREREQEERRRRDGWR
uniref:Uncharacterized protein n=1 Tax=Triticum urartu TaxID=4572 RepID=A0A8R7QFH7_TRIUA